MNALLDYLRLIGYFTVAVLIWGSGVYMKRIWYVPLIMGFWFFMTGLMLFCGIVAEDISVTSNGMAWFGTPILFVIVLALMRAYWRLTTHRYRDRRGDD